MGIGATCFLGTKWRPGRWLGRAACSKACAGEKCLTAREEPPKEAAWSGRWGAAGRGQTWTAAGDGRSGIRQVTKEPAAEAARRGRADLCAFATGYSSTREIRHFTPLELPSPRPTPSVEPQKQQAVEVAEHGECRDDLLSVPSIGFQSQAKRGDWDAFK